MRAEQLTGPVAHHGEGPCWWDGWGGLKFVDMLAGDVMSLREDGSVWRAPIGTVAAALRPRAGGGAVVATERSFALCANDDLSGVTHLPDVWSDTAIRFNDGGCDPEGAFWCGTMAYDETPGAGTMYRLSPGSPGQDPQVETMWGDVTISNGFAFSPDGSRAYYNDTPTKTIQVFDHDPDKGLTNRRVLVRIEDERAAGPDGLCVDGEGSVWAAVYGTGEVHRYSPDGRLDGIVELPVTHVTACTFGGPDLRTLYVTTTAEGLEPGAQPEAGSLFCAHPDVTGQPTLPFRG
ncbi:MAG TPA: SMP-30/gluconolactonase/LRE family protein [Segeticoccus sp.]|nr:SMP-30/gluconolactonase/LRE family protein [Segeticoccus sp.]